MFLQNKEVCASKIRLETLNEANTKTAKPTYYPLPSLISGIKKNIFKYKFSLTLKWKSGLSFFNLNPFMPKGKRKVNA